METLIVQMDRDSVTVLRVVGPKEVKATVTGVVELLDVEFHAQVEMVACGRSVGDVLAAIEEAARCAKEAA